MVLEKVRAIASGDHKAVTEAISVLAKELSLKNETVEVLEYLCICISSIVSKHKRGGELYNIVAECRNIDEVCAYAMIIGELLAELARCKRKEHPYQQELCKSILSCIELAGVAVSEKHGKLGAVWFKMKLSRASKKDIPKILEAHDKCAKRCGC